MKRLFKFFILCILSSALLLCGCEEEPENDDALPLTYYEIFQIVNNNAANANSNYLVNAEIMTTVYKGDETNPSELLSISYTNQYDGENLYIYEQTITVSKDEEGKDVSTTFLVENTYYDNQRYVSYVSSIGDKVEAEETVVPNQETPTKDLVNLSLSLSNTHFTNARYSKEHGKNVIIIPASIDVCAMVTTYMLPSLQIGISSDAHAYEGSLQYIYDDAYNFIGVILSTHIHLDDGSGLAFDYEFKLELAASGNCVVSNPKEK